MDEESEGEENDEFVSEVNKEEEEEEGEGDFDVEGLSVLCIEIGR